MALLFFDSRVISAENSWDKAVREMVDASQSIIKVFDIFLKKNQQAAPTIADKLDYSQVAGLFENKNAQLSGFLPFDKAKYRGKLFRNLSIPGFKGNKHLQTIVTFLYTSGNLVDKGNFKFFIHPYEIRKDAAETDSPWPICREINDVNNVNFVEKVLKKIKPAKANAGTLMQEGFINKCSTENTDFTIWMRQKICKVDQETFEIVNILSIKSKTYYNLMFRGSEAENNKVYAVFSHKKMSLQSFENKFDNSSYRKSIPYCFSS